MPAPIHDEEPRKREWIWNESKPEALPARDVRAEQIAQMQQQNTKARYQNDISPTLYGSEKDAWQ